MPIVISSVDAINNLRFQPFNKAQVYKGVDVMVADQGSTVIIRQKNGTLRCNRLRSNCAYLPGNWEWSKAFLCGLVKLGVITQADSDQHLSDVARSKEKDEARYAAKSLANGAETLGIKLTKAQQRAIDDAIGGK